MPDALITYFAMDGYALYVWPSYALSLIALVLLGVHSFRRMKKLEAEAARQRKAETR